MWDAIPHPGHVDSYTEHAQCRTRSRTSPPRKRPGGYYLSADGTAHDAHGNPS
jgi:hypothetical protein